MVDGPADTSTHCNRHETIKKKLIDICILGYLLVFGPTDTARKHVAETILTDKNQGDPDQVISQGGFYDQLFLHFCKFSLLWLDLETNP